jgi:hypothetical protein
MTIYKWNKYHQNFVKNIKFNTLINNSLNKFVDIKEKIL